MAFPGIETRVIFFITKYKMAKLETHTLLSGILLAIAATAADIESVPGALDAGLWCDC